MSSIDSSTRKNNQTELAELQAEHNRKRRELVAKNEQDIKDLKGFYDQKKSGILEDGQAAVNHIRDRQQQQIDHAAAERERMAQSYRNTSAALSNSHQERLTETKEKNDSALAQAKTQGQQKVKTAEYESHARLKNIEEKGSYDLARTKQNQSAQLRSTEELHSSRLQNQKENNSLAVQSEIERGRSAQAKLKGQIEEEFGKTWVRGEDKIEKLEVSNQAQVDRLNDHHEKKFDQAQRYWENREDHLIDQYTRRLDHQKQANENQLKNQNERFLSVYSKNENAQQEALTIQKQHFQRSLAETKKDFAKSAEKYTNRESDPFYKVTDRGSELRENPEFYFLKTFIPEHEKDNVKVSVHNDRVTVSGQRSFKDKLDDGNKSLSSSNFQTFREEFSFDSPVNTKNMTREREGDWVVFTIPKGMANRLNTKA